MLAIGYFLFGLALLVHWALAMFTDTGLGEFAREISADMGAKNNLALIVPSTALMFLFGTVFGFGEPDSVFEVVCGSMSAFFLLIASVGFLPISLPAWMYPEWHARRRCQRLGAEGGWRNTGLSDLGEDISPTTGHADTLPGSTATNLSSDSSGGDI